MQASVRGARSMQTRCGDRYTHRHDAPRRRSSHDCRTGIRRHRGKRRDRWTDLAHRRQSARPSTARHGCLPSNERGEGPTTAQDPGRSVWPISVHRRTRIGISEHPQERPRRHYRQCSSQRATAAGAAWETRPLQDPRPPEAEHAGPGGTRVSGRRGPSLWEAGSRQGESRGPICDPPASPPKRGDDSPGRARGRRPSADSGEVGRDHGARPRRSGVDNVDSDAYRLAWTVSVRLPLPTNFHAPRPTSFVLSSLASAAIHFFAGGHASAARR